MKEGRTVLFGDKRQALRRALAGAAVGVALHLLLGYLMGCFSLFGPFSFRGFYFPNCGVHYQWETLGVTLSFVLFALFGAEAGISTLPFAGHGRALTIRTILHFLLMEATAGLWVALNFGLREVPACLVPLTLVYCMIWLARWTIWHSEVEAIRKKLGLIPKPSQWKWKETLPSIPVILLICLGLPWLLQLLEGGGIGLLGGAIYVELLLPIGCMAAGMFLGERHGFCPLYPVLCAVGVLPAVLLLYNDTILVLLCAIAFGSGLLGVAAGAWPRKKKED